MRRAGEQGFALISAVWLLTLAAAIAAMLTLHSLRQARDVAAAKDAASMRLDLDDALARLVASMLFQGPAGSWGHIPAKGVLDLDQGHADVAIEREDKRLDVNKAALGDIDRALQDKGFSADARNQIAARLATARAAHRLIGTFADVQSAGSGILPPDRAACLNVVLSPFGGLQIGPSTIGDTVPVRVGDTLRVTIGQGAQTRIAVIRLQGMRDDPYSVLDWYDGTCPQAVAA